MAFRNSIATRLAMATIARITLTWTNSESITNTRITTVIRTPLTIELSTRNWESEMSNRTEVFRDNYLPAWWYAYGKSDQDMRIATEFANYFALSRLESDYHIGIPDSFQKWSESR